VCFLEDAGVIPFILYDTRITLIFTLQFTPYLSTLFYYTACLCNELRSLLRVRSGWILIRPWRLVVGTLYAIFRVVSISKVGPCHVDYKRLRVNFGARILIGA
jgi:hypothetical protein